MKKSGILEVVFNCYGDIDRVVKCSASESEATLGYFVLRLTGEKEVKIVQGALKQALQGEAIGGAETK